MKKHDPVSAITEAEATGETAAIFADIRDTMQIPLLTSIWRTLASVENGLPAVWKVTKPLFETGQPGAALQHIKKHVLLPIPEPMVEGQLESAGVTERDLPIIRAIVDVYNRSNGMNLLALTALITEPGESRESYAIAQQPSSLPDLPALPTQADINAKLWTFLHNLNALGASPDEPGLATLWRHLTHWPGLLALIHAGFAPLQKDGTIEHAIQQMLDAARSTGSRLAHLRPATLAIPGAARDMISKYVQHPGLVVRMVVIGHGLAAWLHQYEGIKH